jgi:hypothetical protein
MKDDDIYLFIYFKINHKENKHRKRKNTYLTVFQLKKEKTPIYLSYLVFCTLSKVNLNKKINKNLFLFYFFIKFNQHNQI